EDVAGDGIAVLRGGLALNRALLFEPACYAVQSLVRQFVGHGAALAVEVRREAAPHLQVLPAFGLRALVEPPEEPVESASRERALLLPPRLLHGNIAHP